MARRRPAVEPERARSTARALREADGCLVCQAVDQATDRFWFWLVTESYQYPETIAGLRAGLGMCPTHTRGLLGVAAPPVLVAIQLQVVDAARRRLDGSAPTTHAGTRSCPVCASLAHTARHQTSELLRALGDPEVAEAYRAIGGLCTGHVLGALDAARDPAGERLLVAVLGERLAAFGTERPGPLVAFLAGDDRDGPARWRLRDLAADEPTDRPGPGLPSRATLARLHALLEVDACPACLTGARMERRWLEWVLTDHGGETTAPAWQDAETCPTHLHDLAAADPEIGERVAARQAERLQADLARVDTALAALPPANPLARLAALPQTCRTAWARGSSLRLAGRLRTVGAALGRSARRDHRKALALLPRSGRCGGCTAWDTAARRTLELLLAGLADRPTAQRYQAAHGLCLHHVLTLGDGLSAPLPAEVLQARLGVLAWELAEVQRKHAWAVRYEPAGTEAAAWWRAAALLDGRVFCGGPAMPLPASQAPHQATQDDPRSA